MNFLFIVLLSSVIFLSGCNNNAMSVNQSNFEETAVKQSFNRIFWSLPDTDIMPSREHYFYLDKYSVVASPTTGDQLINKTEINLTKSLALPLDDMKPERLVVNGDVYLLNDYSSAKWNYSNGNITKTYYSSDSKQALLSFVYDHWSSSIPLTGVIIGSEFAKHNLGFTDLGEPHNFDENYKWLPDSSYVVKKSFQQNDALFLKDWSPTEVTVDTNVIPLRAKGINTIETYFNYLISSGKEPLVHDGVSYGIKDGAIKTIQGLRTWVANKPKPTQYKATPEYLSISEMKGMLYEGYFIPSGTRQMVNDPSNTEIILDYSVALNDQAIASIKNLIKF